MEKWKAYSFTFARPCVKWILSETHTERKKWSISVCANARNPYKEKEVASLSGVCDLG